MNLTLIIIVVAILLFLIYYNKNTSNNNAEDKCEDVVYDPQTMKKLPISSEKGHRLFKYKMIHYFHKYLQDTKGDWNYVLPEDFHKMDTSKMFILDVRKPEDYKKGHIKGSLNIFWLDLMNPENLNKLPKDKDILIVCYVGHTASQVLVLLKLLGYKAKVLKFGMGKSPTKGVPIAGWTDYGFEITTE